LLRFTVLFTTTDVGELLFDIVDPNVIGYMVVVIIWDL